MAKYSDCPSVEVEVVVDAPPSAVWELVADIELPVRFSSELQGVEWRDGATEAAVGARFTGRNRHRAIGEWETTCTVVEHEPGRALSWAVGDPASPSATWRFDLAPAGDGRTHLRQEARLGPGRSGLSAAIEAMPDKEDRIIERRLAEHEANMRANLEGIKALAEAGRGAPRGPASPPGSSQMS